MPGEEQGRRHWRYVEFDDSAIESGNLEILRRIDPSGGTPCEASEVADRLEAAWGMAVADIVEAHNRRADLRAEEEPIGPRQRWAQDVLRDPAVAYPAGAELADETLSVGRSSSVRRALGEIEAEVVAGTLTLDVAAARIVSVVMEFGLQPVPPPPLAEAVDEEDVGVVCWMAVLPPT